MAEFFTIQASGYSLNGIAKWPAIQIEKQKISLLNFDLG
jgi:hypothetical protein